MHRREFLKGIAALPVAGALGGCRHHKPTAHGPGLSADYHTLQIGIEGAFAMVIQKNKGSRILAFVPRSSDPELQHHVYFNGAKPLERETAFHFEVPQDGIKVAAKPYINPDFKDFSAETENWHLGENIITLDLPPPDSINFSMRPMPVKFKSGRHGKMPTNHILEYVLEDAQKLKITCSQIGEENCKPLPHCPPGVARFFFGVAPLNWNGVPSHGEDLERNPAKEKHAVDFFNFTLQTRFPDIVAQYSLEGIGPKYYRPEDDEKVTPTVLRNDQPRAKLRRVASLVDCDVGGILARTSRPPVG